MCFWPHSVNTLQHVGLSNYCVHISSTVNHILMISPLLRILEMIVWPSDCFVQPHSLMMSQWDPKYVGVFKIKTL